ncbi:MAG: YbaB/EbfC family nucleoid-associated protein [Gemmatimonadaceae bacterium]|jgi:nucleoid-associated protein EbfC|uniref:YbaB/EbfC family nucleoid-associated protein n=1 Tax=Gemmatimonas sp. UBA7669 TaxID=1946568 RepID=UPI0025C1E382|nr:YbaB/EbfC family nucleoid-associated protein [Gemmatimonas sp. UBA7669]MBA3917401.1 nucleoid-associated protein [Gemmatimonas sp.]MBL0891140.1 YbaB/EbfC family nucleoid-associated protein [Gemmatimonadaceae bacterium]MBX9855955.1 YbaB/EbfC family nucleoid-associated protein [Gemmatimonadaceae bacterium]
MDLFKMLGQFKDMQSRMQAMQEEMSQRTFSALAGGGMVSADVDGKMQLKRIQIDPSIMNDKEMVEDLIVVAVAEAQKKAADAMQMELQKVTGGIDLPFKLPF